jgi:ketosteroid isomerase-like protein
MLDDKEKTMLDHVTEMFADIDTMDADKFVSHLTPDGHFQFGNAEPTVGRAATRDGVAGFFSTINGLHHTITGFWQEGDVVIVELSIDYTRKDDKVVTLPCANIFRMHGLLVRDYRIFMDVSPIFA